MLATISNDDLLTILLVLAIICAFLFILRR